MDELSLDHCFWREISNSAAFREWLLSRTKFQSLPLSLVTSEKWHQRWYRDPDSKKDSETDILLIFTDTNTGHRYALHIENKPVHGKWEPNQAVNYPKRAANRMAAWRYIDSQTVLLAPSSFIQRHPHEASHFDIFISYEMVGKFVQEFQTELDATEASPTARTSN